jgi:ankyrin repeat protein
VGAPLTFKQSGLNIAFLLSFLFGFSDPMLAQEERGTVKVESLSVYPQMSADADAVATLARGKTVRVTLSITNGDGMWCSVSDIDSSVKLGFVRCEGLDRQNAPSTAASGAGGIAVAAGTANEHPSRAQQRWAIAASAILSGANHENLSTLSSGDSALSIRHLLQDSWGISDRDSFLQALEWIDQGGHRQLFSALGERSSRASAEELSAVISKLNSEDANSLTMAHRYYEKFGSQSITAWDYGRYINLCRWGVAAGYISEEEGWPRAMHAAQILQQTFGSWKEFGENYIVGREFWSLRQTKINGQEMRSRYQRLVSDPASPWNRIPWELSLQPSESATSSTMTSASGSPPMTPGKATGPCEALEHMAATGQVSDLEALLKENPGPVNCRDSRGWTPLHYAAFDARGDLIPPLVARGAVVNATDNDGITPLHAAASSGSADAIEALLLNGANINAVDHNGNTPLQHAAGIGNPDATDALLRHHAATEVRSHNGHTALNTAARNGHADVVRLLLQHGANLESKDNDGYTPLNYAAWFEHQDVAALLLEAGANPNTRNKRGATPLQGAATKGSVQGATLLLEHGAHVNLGDAHGFTALHVAANNDQAEVAAFLLAHGADINARTDSGDTPLHWAAYNGKMDAAKLLLEKCAQINASDKDGNTPLHWAAAKGHVEMTEMLIAHGANMKALTRFGCTPLRGANDFHRTATARVLQQHGATL